MQRCLINAVLFLVFLSIGFLTGCRSQIGGGLTGASVPEDAGTLNQEDSTTIPSITLTSVRFLPEEGLVRGEPAVMEITWEGGPENVCLEVLINSATGFGITGATSPSYVEFTPSYDGLHAWNLRLTGEKNQCVQMDGGVYVFPVARERCLPVIASVEYDPDTGRMLVDVDDLDGDYIDITVTPPTGCIVCPSQAHIKSWDSPAVFYWYPGDPEAAEGGTAVISATDRWHSDDAATTQQLIAFNIDQDPSLTLTATPLQTAVRVGRIVTVVVSSGPFPDDAAFAYMNTVGVTVDDGAVFMPGSVNVGAVGGETSDPDGIWSGVRPDGFLLPDDYMLDLSEVVGDATLAYCDFNITPVGGGHTTSGGDLFNFGITFAEPGIYRLGFLEFQNVKRTYYSDHRAAEHGWRNLSNYTGVPNHIVVTE